MLILKQPFGVIDTHTLHFSRWQGEFKQWLVGTQYPDKEVIVGSPGLATLVCSAVVGSGSLWDSGSWWLE